MRTATLIIFAAVAVTLSACNKPAEETTEAPTEAAEASGGVTDTAAMTAEGAAAEAAAAANAGGSTSAAGAGTLAPTSEESPSDGTVAPNAQVPVTGT